MKRFNYVLLVSFVLMLIAGCSKMEIQPDSLNPSDDTALKGAKVKFVPFSSEFNTWGVSETYIFIDGDPDPIVIGVHVVVAGIGKAKHLGKTEMIVDQNWYFGNPLTGDSEITLKAANGDLLILGFIGDMYPNGPGKWIISGVGTFNDGTGRFEDAEVNNLIIEATWDASKGDAGEGETFISGEIKY